MFNDISNANNPSYPAALYLAVKFYTQKFLHEKIHFLQNAFLYEKQKTALPENFREESLQILIFRPASKS